MNAVRDCGDDSCNDSQWCERVVRVSAVNQGQGHWNGNRGFHDGAEQGNLAVGLSLWRVNAPSTAEPIPVSCCEANLTCIITAPYKA